MPAWKELEIQKLLQTVDAFNTEKKWIGDNLYDRKNASSWRAIKFRMGSNRDYKVIRQRYKQHHDPSILANANRALTQQEERILRKFVLASPGGTVRCKKGFEEAATRLNLLVRQAKKR